MSAVRELNSDDQFVAAIAQASGGPVALNFWATWAEPCGQMNEVFDELAKKHSNITFLKIEAENLPETSEKYEIVSVPTFLLLTGNKVATRLEGANAPALNAAVSKLASAKSTTASVPSAKSAPTPAPAAAIVATAKASAEAQIESTAELNARIKALISEYPVMLFMKGTPQQPRCGFSRQTIELLNGLKVDYHTFNILADEAVRAGLKEYSNWPTYPQIYVNGELVGGLDILKELIESGEFQEMVPKKEELNDRLKRLINTAPLTVFIKGTPEQPRCGFSRQLVQILEDKKVKFEHFDILSDEDVRQGLKTYSNWPTFPQIYFNGELIGGLDIIKELDAAGELDELIAKTQ